MKLSYLHKHGEAQRSLYARLKSRSVFGSPLPDSISGFALQLGTELSIVSTYRSSSSNGPCLGINVVMATSAWL